MPRFPGPRPLNGPHQPLESGATRRPRLEPVDLPRPGFGGVGSEEGCCRDPFLAEPRMGARWRPRGILQKVVHGTISVDAAAADTCMHSTGLAVLMVHKRFVCNGLCW